MRVGLRVIMRDLAGDMVQNVRLRDTVCGMRTNPAHDGAEVPKQAAVQRSEGTTLEIVYVRAVVGQKRVRVLQEGDQDEPVVDPGQVRELRVQMTNKKLGAYQRYGTR